MSRTLGWRDSRDGTTELFRVLNILAEYFGEPKLRNGADRSREVLRESLRGRHSRGLKHGLAGYRGNIVKGKGQVQISTV